MKTPEKTKNTILQMRRGILEFCIVKLLHREEVYAAQLIDRLKQANLLVTDGTLYPLLNRLQKSGVLQHRWEESQSGPPRKYYSLTAEGQILLTQLESAWQDIEASVKSIRQDGLTKIDQISGSGETL